jgi:tetratricopeptide (TPR) repeat protein
MGTLSDLFVLLDGWEERRFDDELILSPDPALEAARSAVASGDGLDEALAAVSEQIVVAAPALRAARYDLLAATSRSERDPDADLLELMLCDLHLAAFRILRRQGALDDARAHLVRAATTQSANSDPRLYFVEVYVALGDYAAAVATLAADPTTTATTEGAFALFELGVDLVAKGALDEARDAFARAVDLDPVGVVTAICQLRESEMDRGEVAKPAPEQLQGVFASAGRALADRLEDEAREGFQYVVAHDPRAARAWFGVGCAHRNAAERAGAAAHSVLAVLLPAASDDKRPAITEAMHDQMACAAACFALAVGLERDMWPAADALVWAHLTLDRPDEALDVARWAAEREPGNPNVMATLGVALLRSGHVSDAAHAAAAALKTDPGNPIADETLLIIQAANEQVSVR